MLCKAIVILTNLVLISNPITAQYVFNYGPELGISITQFPKTESYKYGTNLYLFKHKSTPIIGPILGIIGQLSIREHVEIAIGLQYQMSGRRHDFHREEFDSISNSIQISEHIEKQTFHKICLPLTVGYRFKLWKIQPSINLGYRLNFFVSGKHYYKSFTATTNTAFEYDYNPFDSEQTIESAKRFNHQILIGVSTLISQHFNISLTYSLGQELQYSVYATIMNGPISVRVEDSNYFKNSDIGLSVSYLILSPKKDKESLETEN